MSRGIYQHDVATINLNTALAGFAIEQAKQGRIRLKDPDGPMSPATFWDIASIGMSYGFDSEVDGGWDLRPDPNHGWPYHPVIVAVVNFTQDIMTADVEYDSTGIIATPINTSYNPVTKLDTSYQPNIIPGVKLIDNEYCPGLGAFGFRNESILSGSEGTINFAMADPIFASNLELYFNHHHSHDVSLNKYSVIDKTVDDDPKLPYKVYTSIGKADLLLGYDLAQGGTPALVTMAVVPNDSMYA